MLHCGPVTISFDGGSLVGFVQQIDTTYDRDGWMVTNISVLVTAQREEKAPAPAAEAAPPEEAQSWLRKRRAIDVANKAQ